MKGAKLGALVTDGASAGIVSALRTAVEEAGGMFEVVAPKIGGATLDNGALLPAQQKIDGGPSVLYDAVAIVVSKKGAALLQKDAPTRDFIADAFAHCKFIGYTDTAMLLLEKAGIANNLDEGCVALGDDNARQFVAMLGDLRVWPRETTVDADA